MDAKLIILLYLFIFILLVELLVFQRRKRRYIQGKKTPTLIWSIYLINAIILVVFVLANLHYEWGIIHYYPFYGFLFSVCFFIPYLYLYGEIPYVSFLSFLLIYSFAIWSIILLKEPEMVLAILLISTFAHLIARRKLKSSKI